MSHITFEMLLQVTAIARQAGDLVMEVYAQSAIATDFKEDQSPLTEADLRSHSYIIEALSSSFPFPVLSEEHILAYEKRRDWDAFWLVDPLDGTRDFLARNGEFTINIALIVNNVPVLGVIYAPAVDELYFAGQGLGAFCHKAGQEERLLGRETPERVLAISRFHDAPEMAGFAVNNAVSRVLPIGSALKFGRLAAGDVTLYPRFSGSKEWDIAAGHAIVREAGCRIVDLVTCEEPVYNKPNLHNNYFIAHTGNLDLAELWLPRLR